MLYCLVVGTRTFTDYESFKAKMQAILAGRTEITIVSGGARGTDALAKRYAKENGFVYKEFKADWDKYGKGAGFIRNEQMHRYISKYPNRICIAFWDGKSKGTKQSFELAKKYQSPLRLFFIK